MKRQTSGYILMLTVMVLALLVALMSYMMFRASAYSPFTRSMVDREKAAMLAFSGVQIACGQLSIVPESKEGKDGKSEKQDPNADRITLLKTVLPVKNLWQTFILKKAQDGINGTIQICLMSEDGKININECYDFKKHTFVGEGKAQGDCKKLLQMLFDRIKTETGGENLFPVFEKFLKERQYKLRDITELLTIKEFEIFKDRVFYEPSEQKKDENKEKQSLFLTDIFTVWSGQETIDPWLFSKAMCILLSLECATADVTKNKELLEALKKFNAQSPWNTDWDKLLAPIYGKKFDTLPKDIESFLSTVSDPTTFSVLSYGKVGKITQKVLAIIERQPASKDNEEQVSVIIKKLYWL